MRKFLVAIFAFILVVLYQNCQQPFQVDSALLKSETPDDLLPTPKSDPELPVVITPNPYPDPDPVAVKTLSEKYPGDRNIGNDASVLLFDNFESGWGTWKYPNKDTTYLSIPSNSQLANGGSRYLKSTVTYDHLKQKQYIGAMTQYDFPRRVDKVFIRFYARFKGVAPKPHHWVRVSAGSSSYTSSGIANTKPSGNEGFWFDFDIHNTKKVFNFYNYWYKMHSSRCNDGSVTPGCVGDQGVTNYYGNEFRPSGQTAFNNDQWICIEMMAKTNDVGTHSGEQAFWVNSKLAGHYRTGNPKGAWLRDKFHEEGKCSYGSCPADAPFEGFDFRSSSDVKFKQLFLDSYYQKNTFENKKKELQNMGLNPSDEQTIYYDDVVVATQRIGCKVQ